MCGLPSGDSALTAPGVAMENVIGDEANRWADLLAEPGAHVHLYGKTVRPGRKMGHVTRLMRCFGAKMASISRHLSAGGDRYLERVERRTAIDPNLRWGEDRGTGGRGRAVTNK